MVEPQKACSDSWFYQAALCLSHFLKYLRLYSFACRASDLTLTASSLYLGIVYRQGLSVSLLFQCNGSSKPHIDYGMKGFHVALISGM